MRIFTCLAAVSALVVAVAAAPAWAQVNVGDELELSFETIDGKKLDKSLKGKLVLIDFWATWCGPCMQQVPHMKSLNEELGPKGLVIVGVSADRTLDDLKKGITQHEMNWAHVFDEGGRIGNQFGIRGYPTVFLVGPDSTVLWTGHPAELDGALAEAFEKHPPVLIDPKMLKSAQETLATVTKKLEAGDATAALKLMAKVPEDASKDADFARAAKETRAKLDEAAAGLLKGAEEKAAAGEYAEAADRLRELSVSLAGLPVASEAKQKLAELMAKPGARKAIELAAKEAQAGPALAEAQKLRAAKKHDTAYPRFKQLAKAYAGTPSGAEAAKVVKAYEADKAFMAKVAAREAGGKAKAALSVARSYAKAGRKDDAAKKFKAIIKDYPGTEQARAAESELKLLK